MASFRRRSKFRFHLLGLAHLPCSKQYIACAFTQKNHKLARMLLSLGHEVIYYGCENSDVPCTHFVQTHTLSDLRKDYGDGDNRFEVGYDWTGTEFRHDFHLDDRKPSTKKFYAKCIEIINMTKKPDDFLLCTQGLYHKPIYDAVGLYLSCEPGIGYRGSFLQFKAFESAAIENHAYGSAAPWQCSNGNYYDRVIPNYFDPDDIEFSDQKEDYYLFIGRMMKRKGILTAAYAINAIGGKLIIAGQGGVVQADGSLTSATNPDFILPKGNWEYIGFADLGKRKKLMAHAKATFTPTEYLEPFAGTHIESMLSGTPVITTNFGVFPGTVTNGVNGYRCDTLDDFVWAAKNVKKLDPHTIRKGAERYLMDNVRWDFQRWFEDLYYVWESTQPNGRQGWHYIRDREPEWRKHIKW